MKFYTLFSSLYPENLTKVQKVGYSHLLTCMKFLDEVNEFVEGRYLLHVIETNLDTTGI